jgi:hemolysin III
MGYRSPPTRTAAVSRPASTPLAFRRGEHAADLWVLVCGLGLGAAGSVALLASALAGDDPRIVAGASIYVAGLMAMLGCSLLYHGAIRSPRRPLFRRLDHAAIFAMIAGTATPFALSRGDERGSALVAAIWAAAALGIVFKLRYPIGRARRSTAVYVVLGWVSVIAIWPALSSREILRLVIAGGAFYTIGVGFHLSFRLPYHRAVWHGFVVAGAVCHYLAIIDGVVFA